MALARRPYVGVQVNLASHLIVYNLYELINAVIAAEVKWDSVVTVPGGAREVFLQNDPANSDVIKVGDALMVAGATGRCGYVISLGGERHYGTGDTAGVQVASLYVNSPTDNQKLNVEVMAG